MESCLINYRESELKDFSINDNKELIYKQYNSNKGIWDEVKRVDYNVTEFKLDIDVKGVIHIVYADNIGLKYAILSDDEISRLTLFNYNSKYYKMDNIKFLINKGRMDIISTLYDSGNKNKRTLVHYERTNNGSKSRIITEFELDKKMNIYYDVIYYNNMIKVFINKGTGKENEILSTQYLNTWSDLEKVHSYYGRIKGFIVKEYLRGCVFLRISEEYSLNVITREIFDEKFNLVEKNRYSSSNRISDPLVVVDKGEIWGFWKEKGQILGGNFTEEIILPRKISGSSGTIKMEYIIFKDKKIKRQSLFGINDPRKPFLLDEVFNEEVITWKFEEEFYKDKEEIITKLFKELKNRELNIVEMMKRGREIEGIIRERDEALKELNDRYRRVSNQNKNMSEQLKEVASFKESLGHERKVHEQQLKEFIKKDKLLDAKIKSLTLDKSMLIEEKVKLIDENKTLKENVTIKDMLIKDHKNIEILNKTLNEKVQELEKKVNEVNNNLRFEREILVKEKERHSKEIEGLNKIIAERKDIERLLNNVESNKNTGFFRKMFKSRDRED